MASLLQNEPLHPADAPKTGRSAPRRKTLFPPLHCRIHAAFLLRHVRNVHAGESDRSEKNDPYANG